VKLKFRCYPTGVSYWHHIAGVTTPPVTDLSIVSELLAVISYYFMSHCAVNINVNPLLTYQEKMIVPCTYNQRNRLDRRKTNDQRQRSLTVAGHAASPTRRFNTDNTRDACHNHLYSSCPRVGLLNRRRRRRLRRQATSMWYSRSGQMTTSLHEVIIASTAKSPGMMVRTLSLFSHCVPKELKVMWNSLSCTDSTCVSSSSSLIVILPLLVLMQPMHDCNRCPFLPASVLPHHRWGDRT